MHPLFARLRPRLERAREELAHLEAVRQGATYPDEASRRWGIATVTATAIENIYSGIEEILRSLAANLDEAVPRGEDWYRELLEQMAIATDTRPAILTPALHAKLDRLRQFRHVIRHRYAFELDPQRVEDLHDVCVQALAEFERRMEAVGRDIGG